MEVGRLEARISELQQALADKEKALQQAQTAVDKERAQNAELASDNAALVTRVDERDE